MKQINIDFTAQTAISDYCFGRIGEHNATELTITPPDVLSGDSRTVMYRIAFGTGSATVLSQSYTESPIVLLLWQQLTMHARLSLQVIAYDSEGEFIGKSEKLTDLYFEPSVEAKNAINEDDTPDITAEIAENTAARHTHSNIDVLDAITDVPNEPVELRDLGTQSKYTADELGAMSNKHFTYKGLPVLSTSYSLIGSEFKFTYIKTTNNLQYVQYVTECVINNSKTITEGNTRTVPFTVNGISARTTDGAVILKGENIKASANWVPSEEGDLIPKGYFDSNKGDKLPTYTSADNNKCLVLGDNGPEWREPAGGIVEKVLELDVDFIYCSIYNNLFGNGSEIVLEGNQTASGGLLHNCRITGIEGYAGGTWNSLNALYALGTTVIICNMPFVLNDGNDDYTILGYSTTASVTLEAVEKVRIHYIELDGIETVTP